VFCILALFGLEPVWATFQKIGRFFPNHLVTLRWTHLEQNFFSILESHLSVEAVQLDVRSPGQLMPTLIFLLRHSRCGKISQSVCPDISG
jgi:hypothetical protein